MHLNPSPQVSKMVFLDGRDGEETNMACKVPKIDIDFKVIVFLKSEVTYGGGE